MGRTEKSTASASLTWPRSRPTDVRNTLQPVRTPTSIAEIVNDRELAVCSLSPAHTIGVEWRSRREDARRKPWPR